MIAKTSADLKADDDTEVMAHTTRQNSGGSSTDDTPGTLIPQGKESLGTGARTNPSASENLEPILTTAAGRAITAPSTAITIPNTIVKPGNPGTTLGGNPVALDTSGYLVLDSKNIPVPTGTDSRKFTTTVAGRIIVATSAAITIAGTTHGSEDAGPSLDGTPPSLDTAGVLGAGASTHKFDSESVGLGAVTTGIFGIVGTSAAGFGTSRGGNATVGTGRKLITSTGVQAFEGMAKRARSGLRMGEVAAGIMGLVLFMHA